MSGTDKIGVLLVDDHGVIRDGLAILINAQPDMEVIDQASNGRSAVEKTRALSPHVVVMDISMPQLSGKEATALIHQSNPKTRVLVLSMHEERSYLRELLEAGAAGYVLKRSASNDLLRAIRIVANGDVYLDTALAGAVVSNFVRKTPLQGDATRTRLSDREEAVLRLVARGYSNKEVAARLALSVKTVETYKVRSTEKLTLNSRVDIVRYARDQGWLEEL